mgnify:CR=1 FL=1
MKYLSNVNPGIDQIAPYQPGKPVETLERELGIRDSVKLASNENPLGPSPRVMRDLPSQLAQLARYPDGGCFHLKEALGKRFDVDPSMITIGNGSNDVLEILGRLFLRPGTNAVVSEHSFVVYGLVTLAQGAEVREVPARDFGQDLNATLAVIDDNTRIVFIANPNNPTGTYISKRDILKLRKKLRNNILLVVDDAYFEYAQINKNFESGLNLFKNYKNVLITRTFSKIYGLAGLRVGWGYSSNEIIKSLNMLKPPFNVNRAALFAASASIKDTKWLRKEIKHISKWAKKFFKTFQSLKIETNYGHANFMLINFDKVRKNSKKIFFKLANAGILVRKMEVYKIKNSLRVTIGNSKENIKFLKALKKAVNV